MNWRAWTTPRRCRSTPAAWLRKLRERVFCTLIARDLGGQAPLEEVVGAMTALADLAVAETYRSVASELAAVHGVPRDPATGLPQEMLIVGMGKLGGCELNVSSDIDLIMLYGEEGETDGPRRISHHEFYGRLTRRMMPVLSEVDANGQVFRTDLRLRPDGDAGPLAWSLDALEHYLIGQGREWERYAWLKARLMPARAFEGSALRGSWKACACPSCTASISTSTRWRCALRERIRRTGSARQRAQRHRQRQQHQAGRRRHPRDRIRGPAGPADPRRTHAGPAAPRPARSAARRAPPACCPKPTRSGWRPPTASCAAPSTRCSTAKTSRPTCCPATRPAPRWRRRWACRPANSRTRWPRTAPSSRGLSATCSAWSAWATPAPAADAADKEEPDEQCELAGQIRQAFGDEADDLLRRADTLMGSHRVRSLPDASRRRVEALLPARPAARQTPACCRRRCGCSTCETIAQLQRLPALRPNIPTLARVARMVAASPWAAQYLTQHPLLLDSLIDWRTLFEPLDFGQIARQLAADLDACRLPDGDPDIERQMNLMRDVPPASSCWRRIWKASSPLKAGGPAVRPGRPAAGRNHPPRLAAGEPAAGRRARFAVIAYGKLGGKELATPRTWTWCSCSTTRATTPPRSTPSWAGA